MQPTFFKTPAEFRAWLASNHQTATELLVGFYTTKSGKPSMTWPESVDQALCFGWIDAVRKNRDEVSYTIRFTRRKRTSIWSAINIRRVEELERLGLMTEAGREAFAKRKEHRSRIYAYENELKQLDNDAEEEFKSHAAAWQFFNAQAPSYRKRMIYRIVSAKKPETHRARLKKLIEASAAGRRID